MHPAIASSRCRGLRLEVRKTFGEAAKRKTKVIFSNEGVKVAPAVLRAWRPWLAWRLPTTNRVFGEGEKIRGLRQAGSCRGAGDRDRATGHWHDSPVLWVSETPAASATTRALTFCGKLCREHTAIASSLLLVGR